MGSMRDQEPLQDTAGSVSETSQGAAVQRTEELLRQSEEKFRRLFEGSIIGMSITLPTGEVTVNRAFCEMVGYTPDELAAVTWQSLTHPDDVALTAREVQALLDGEKRSTRFEKRFLHKNGSCVWVDLASMVYRDAAGKPIHLMTMLIDITARKRAERELREREEKYRSLFELVSDALLLIDDESGNILEVNTAAETLYGYRRDELLRMRNVDLSAQPDETRRATSSDQSVVPLRYHRRKDGEVFAVEIKATRLTWHGRPAHIPVIRDITERQRAEQQLAERLRFETLLADLSVRFVDVPVEQLDREIRDAQRRVCQCLGLHWSSLWQWSEGTPKALVLTHVYREVEGPPLPERLEARDYFPWCEQGVLAGKVVAVPSPEDLPPTALRDRETYSRLGVKSSVTLPVKAAGDVVVGALSFSTTQDIRLFPEGFVDRLQLVAQLFTNALLRKRSEQALRASEARFRSLSEGSLVGVYIVQNGSLTYVNAALSRVFGYLPTELLAASPLMLVDPADHALVEESARQLLGGEIQSVRHELRGRRKNGETMFLEVLAAQTEVDGRPAIIGNVLDLTERKRLEERFLHAQKMEGIGRLSGSIAHDFNNLLSVILSYTHLATNAEGVGAETRADLSEVQKAAERAVGLTRQLLAFSSRQILHVVPLDLNRAVVGMEKMLRRLLGEEIELDQLLAPELGLVLADPGQLDQVLMNLAVNARDSMKRGGTLTIETCNVELDDESAVGEIAVPRGPYVQLSVTDTGCGIDAATRARLFEPFFTTKEIGKGTGLGLSTVYGIVKQSGGTIVVHSELGRGTTFEVLLPRQLKAKLPVSTPPQAPGRTAGTETILVVEDEEALREVIGRSLAAAGYTVLTAAAGDEALQLSARHADELQLLLTDVVMPRMSGRELAQELLKVRPSLRVLYMSGYTDDAIIQHGVLASGTQFIGKPFAIADLMRRVREVLDNTSLDPT